MLRANIRVQNTPHNSAVWSGEQHPCHRVDRTSRKLRGVLAQSTSNHTEVGATWRVWQGGCWPNPPEPLGHSRINTISQRPQQHLTPISLVSWLTGRAILDWSRGSAGICGRRVQTCDRLCSWALRRGRMPRHCGGWCSRVFALSVVQRSVPLHTWWSKVTPPQLLACLIEVLVLRVMYDVLTKVTAASRMARVMANSDLDDLVTATDVSQCFSALVVWWWDPVLPCQPSHFWHSVRLTSTQLGKRLPSVVWHPFMEELVVQRWRKWWELVVCSALNSRVAAVSVPRTGDLGLDSSIGASGNIEVFVRSPTRSLESRCPSVASLSASLVHGLIK